MNATFFVIINKRFTDMFFNFCLLVILFFECINCYIIHVVLFVDRNPLEVSEEFSQEYNNAKEFDDRERLEQTAQKMLERAKVIMFQMGVVFLFFSCLMLLFFNRNLKLSRHCYYCLLNHLYVYMYPPPPMCQNHVNRKIKCCLILVNILYF